MTAFNLVAALAFVATATAGVIQRDSGTFSHATGAIDGVYIHIINATGQPENIFLGEFKPSLFGVDNTTYSNVTRRDYQGEIKCHNQNTMSYSNIVTAETGLEGFITQQNNQFSTSTLSYVSGGAVAYGCNYGQNGQKITATWLAAQFGNIALKCGASGAGYVTYPDWGAAYGLDKSSVSFC